MGKTKILGTFIFTSFGFDVLLRNVAVKSAQGEEYPDLNLNELKTMTARALLKRPVRMTGFQLKFLRNFLKFSYDALSEEIRVPASTIRLWENRGADVTGLSLEQDKAFRLVALNAILEDERNQFDKELIFTKSFAEPQKKNSVLDLAAGFDDSPIAKA